MHFTQGTQLLEGPFFMTVLRVSLMMLQQSHSVLGAEDAIDDAVAELSLFVTSGAPVAQPTPLGLCSLPCARRHSAIGSNPALFRSAAGQLSTAAAHEFQLDAGFALATSAGAKVGDAAWQRHTPPGMDAFRCTPRRCSTCLVPA